MRRLDSPGEVISYSEWADQASVDNYLRSPAFAEIKRHNRNIKGAEVTVKHYERV